MNQLNSRIEIREGNNVCFNSDYYELFASEGLDSFDSLWRLDIGEVVKEIEDRSVVRFEVHAKDELNETEKGPAVRVFYFKKHARERAGWSGLSEGAREFVNLCDFREAGLATAEPVAMGERHVTSSFVESFLITEDFFPYVSLEDIVRKQPEILKGGANREKRRNILKEIAAYARKMHKHGFNHRDFNATHILIHDIESKTPRIALFDMQRIDRNRLSRFRWAVKALAELNFTLPFEIFPEQERFFLFLSYKGRTKMNLIDRLHWEWVKRKTARIARHTYKRWAKKRVRVYEKNVS
ncbi:MAG: lipopolysaccharide kinase InaA family protein [Thermodesulfobacteriota bacterium]|nr:lipopolysaccharide kinase InaA family protein [Thermodesulfobacteriota bacterium]